MMNIKHSTQNLRSGARRTLRRAAAAGLCAGLLTGMAQAQSQSPSALPEPQQLPAVQLNAGMYNIVAMVARSDEQRQIGLMFRPQMAPHEGMLFVFEQPATQCFWMRNTLLPLSAAFIADDGTIVNIEDMAPQTDASHCSKKPVRYVLEMNQGWFARRGLKPGAKLGGAPFSH